MSTRHSLLVAAMLLVPQLSVNAQTDENIHIDAGNMRFTLEGYGQANYNVADDGNEQTNAFELSRVIFMLNASITPKLNMFTMIDVASKTSEKVLHEYWGNYKFCDELSVKLGQYKTHY